MMKRALKALMLSTLAICVGVGVVYAYEYTGNFTVDGGVSIGTESAAANKLKFANTASTIEFQGQNDALNFAAGADSINMGDGVDKVDFGTGDDYINFAADDDYINFNTGDGDIFFGSPVKASISYLDTVDAYDLAVISQDTVSIESIDGGSKIEVRDDGDVVITLGS